MESKSLLERIRDFEKLTPSEAKIAEYLEQKYPQLAYETITTISSGAGVGNATVGRFVLRLGYKNFADFISLLRNELAQNFESPMVRYFGRRESLSENEGVLGRHIHHATMNMLKTKARISDAEIMNAAKILTQSKGNLYVCGSASGAPLAKYFYLLSKYIRKNSILLSPDISTLTHHLTDVAEDDTLLIIAHKRHAKPSVQVAQWFRSCNSKIVFITDRETSPLAKISDINLFVSSEGPAMFNSRVVTLLLLESLLEAMIFLSGEEVENRLIRFEELFEKLGVYSF